MAKFMTYNRKTGIYSIGKKEVDYKKWWYMAKHLIINKTNCLVQDDDYLLIYEY